MSNITYLVFQWTKGAIYGVYDEEAGVDIRGRRFCSSMVLKSVIIKEYQVAEAALRLLALYRG